MMKETVVVPIVNSVNGKFSTKLPSYFDLQINFIRFWKLLKNYFTINEIAISWEQHQRLIFHLTPFFAFPLFCERRYKLWTKDSLIIRHIVLKETNTRFVYKCSDILHYHNEWLCKFFNLARLICIIKHVESSLYQSSDALRRWST